MIVPQGFVLMKMVNVILHVESLLILTLLLGARLGGTAHGILIKCLGKVVCPTKSSISFVSDQMVSYIAE